MQSDDLHSKPVKFYIRGLCDWIIGESSPALMPYPWAPGTHRGNKI